MLEVPALFLQLPQLLERADFLSIGSNDLVQFLFACDRGNARVNERYDVLSPAVFRLLSDVASHCTAAGVPFSLCGEMAGEPLEAMALVGIGVRSLSMPPGAIDAVRHMIRQLDVGQLEAVVAGMADKSVHSLRGELRKFADSQGVEC